MLTSIGWKYQQAFITCDPPCYTPLCVVVDSLVIQWLQWLIVWVLWPLNCTCGDYCWCLPHNPCGDYCWCLPWGLCTHNTLGHCEKFNWQLQTTLPFMGVLLFSTSPQPIRAPGGSPTVGVVPPEAFLKVGDGPSSLSAHRQVLLAPFPGQARPWGGIKQPFQVSESPQGSVPVSSPSATGVTWRGGSNSFQWDFAELSWDLRLGKRIAPFLFTSGGKMEQTIPTPSIYGSNNVT